LNILYISYTGKILGGGEISLINLLEKLDRTNFTPFLLVIGEGELEKTARALGVKVFILDYRKIKNPLNLIHSLRVIKIIIQIIKDNNIAIVHCNSTGGLTLMSGIAARVCGIPSIWHVRAVERDIVIDSILTGLFTKIIVISKAVIKRLFWLHTKKIEVVHNGVNIERFMPLEAMGPLHKSFIPDGSNIVIGTIGRYNPVKGYEYFLSAACEVLKTVPYARFVIAGIDYDEKNHYLVKLKRQANRLGIEDKVVFTGNCSDVNAMTNAFDICASTSPNEPFGRNIIEAMACAKPFIAFDAGGPREIIENGISGILVEPKNSHALAQAAVELISKPSLRATLGENARKRVENFFTIEMATKKIELLYKQISSFDVECGLCTSHETVIMEEGGRYKVLKCRGCGLVFIWPHPSAQKLAAEYDYAYYAPWITTQAAWREKMWHRRLEKVEKSKKSGNLLDIGCGAPVFLDLAQKHGWQVWGCDISQYAVKYGKEKYGINIFCGEIENSSFKESFFDAVTMWHSLEHTTNPMTKLKEVMILLKPGGVFILAVPNLNNYLYRIVYILLKFKKPPIFSENTSEIHLYHFSPQTITRALTDAGFVNITIKPDIERAYRLERVLDICAGWIFNLTRINIGNAIEIHCKKPDKRL